MTSHVVTHARALTGCPAAMDDEVDDELDEFEHGDKRPADPPSKRAADVTNEDASTTVACACAMLAYMLSLSIWPCT